MKVLTVETNEETQIYDISMQVSKGYLNYKRFIFEFKLVEGYLNYVKNFIKIRVLKNSQTMYIDFNLEEKQFRFKTIYILNSD